MNTIDTAGIAELAGCSREHVTNRLTKRPDFPAPVVNLSQRLRRWSRADVIEWLTSARRSTPPTRGSSAAAGSSDRDAR